MNHMVLQSNQRKILLLFIDSFFFLYLITEILFRHTLIAQASLFIFVLLTVIFMITNRKIKFNLYFLINFLFIFYNWINIKLGISINPSVSYTMLVTLSINLIFSFFMYNYLVIRNNPTKILKMYINSTFIITVIITIFSLPELLSARLGGALGINANLLAITVAISFVIVLYLNDIKRSYKNMMLLIWYLIIVLLTGSRKGLVLVFVASFLYYYFKYPTKRLKNIIISLMFIFISMIAIMNIPFLYDIVGIRVEGLLDYIIIDSTQDGSLNTRSTLISRGWEYFKIRPLRGYGLDSFSSLDGTYGIYAHNNFIEILVSSGVIGFLLYYFPYLINIILALTKRRVLPDYMKLLISILIVLIILDYATTTYYGRNYQLILIFTIAFMNISKKDQVKSQLDT